MHGGWAKDWTGIVAGAVTVIGPSGKVDGRTFWTVRCECGHVRPMRSDRLAAGGATCTHIPNVASPEQVTERNRRIYLKHRPDRLLRASKTRQRADKTPRFRFTKAMSGAKHRGIFWSLRLDAYEELCAQECFYCSGGLGKTEKGSGLDRLENHLGYEAGNVVPCCGTCNRIKGDMLTPEETKAAVLAILEIRNKKTQ
jgi:hypothetical protein